MRKSKNKKNVCALWAVLLFCLLSRLSADAENALQIGIDQYEVLQNGNIKIYVNQNGEDAFHPSLSESTLMIGKNKLDIQSITSFSDTKEPVTYLCLVDVSGSITEAGMKQTKEVITQLTKQKGQQDNFCITTMGNDVESSGFLTDADKLEETIEGIAVKKEDTNLYYSITEALGVLKTDKSVHQKRCLVIFSDGADDQKKGITQKEAEDAVKESHIPVFTIMVDSNLKTDKEEYAKILGSFARNSAGGEHYAPSLEDGYEYADISGKIEKRLQTSMVLTAGLEELKEVGDDTIHINVELSDGTKKAADGITVPSGKIQEAVEAIEEAHKNAELTVTVINEGTEKKEEPSEEPNEKPSKVNNQIVIGIALLALASVFALILLLSRKKAGEDEYDVYETDGYAAVSGGGEFGRAYHEESAAAPSELPQASEGMPKAAKKADTGRKKNTKEKIEVTLFQVGPGGSESYRLTIKTQADIGRNKNCQLSLENDTALSGRHCTILYKDDSVFIKDEESTNGTFVNGVPIVGEYKVEQDDILLIGSSEYRIVWE